MPESQQAERGTKLITNFFKTNRGLNVLDVGCGEGKWARLVGEYVNLDGVEAWAPYIDQYDLRPLYPNLFNVDIMNFDWSKKKYDAVILGDVLEHLEYNQAIELIKALKENVTYIFLSIPVTVCYQDGSNYGNPFETHRYQWSDKEIRDVLGLNLQNVGVNELGLVAIGTYFWMKK